MCYSGPDPAPRKDSNLVSSCPHCQNTSAPSAANRARKGFRTAPACTSAVVSCEGERAYGVQREFAGPLACALSPRRVARTHTSQLSLSPSHSLPLPLLGASARIFAAACCLLCSHVPPLIAHARRPCQAHMRSPALWSAGSPKHGPSHPQLSIPRLPSPTTHRQSPRWQAHRHTGTPEPDACLRPRTTQAASTSTGACRHLMVGDDVRLAQRRWFQRDGPCAHHAFPCFQTTHCVVRKQAGCATATHQHDAASCASVSGVTRPSAASSECTTAWFTARE